MIEKLISRLVREGKLKKQSVGFGQIEKLLKEAGIDIEEAAKIKDISERGTYLLTYIALLKAGRALVLYLGYRPDDGAQHRTVVELVDAVLGQNFAKLTRHFEIKRRKRNDLTYDVDTLLSKSETDLAFKDAVKLIKEITNYLREKNPQMQFKFDK